MKPFVFECDCGRRTKEPFLVGGVKMCAVCAEEFAPELVESKARDWASLAQRGRPHRRRDLWKDTEWH